MTELSPKYDQNIKEINEKVKEASLFIHEINAELSKVIVGQKYLTERLLMALLANGHILIEGVPGLAKTLAVKTLSRCIQTKFQRIQFTPDLLPADLLGTLVYNPKECVFTTRKGPIFSNLILADEINRAPAKVQSALLEAMQERQVTIGEDTFKLQEPFIVLATQNPIEQEGTYPLPEAQVDRFMLKIKIDYPEKKEEKEIMERMAGHEPEEVNAVIDPKDILKARGIVNEIYIDEKIKDYIVDLVYATRIPEEYKLDIKNFIAYGASPRASIYLNIASKANAFIRGRGYVTPEDVKAVGMDVLRHRVIVNYEAEAEELTSEDIVKKIFDQIEVP
ncbi:MAG: MoxR family ATPase [Candidatus Omnitrophica bacterium]|nr:MoxR family ATPase [Candidatus Omnitrophota bacterium]